MGRCDGVGGDGRSDDELRALRAEVADLRQRNAALEAVIELFDDTVFVKDGGGRYRIVNSAGARRVGRTAEGIVGRDDSELFGPEAARRIAEDDRRIIAEGAPRTFEEEMTSAGVARTYRTTKAPYRDEGGAVVGVIGIARDITEPRRAEEELREAREFLSLLLENSPATIYVTDRDGRVRLVNAAWEAFWGPRREDAIGRMLVEIFPPGLAARFLAQNEAVIATEVPLDFDNDVAVDGVHRHFYTVKFPLRDAAHRIVAVGGISIDITERKRAEETLARDAHLLANVRDSVIVTDMDGIVTYWNDGATRLFGWRADEMAGRPLLERVPEEGRGQMADTARAIADGVDFDGEWEDYRKDGSRIWIEARVTRITDASGAPIGLMGLAHDISDRKRAEEALRESEEWFRLLLDSAGEAIVGVDLEGRCTFCNAASLRLLGYSDPRELLGQDMHRLTHHTRPDGTPYPREECRTIRAYLSGDGTHSEDELLWRADGTSFPAEFWSHPMRRGGEVVGAVVTWVDISERRRVAERLQVLSRRVVEVQEEERRHLARELHDEIGQSLTAIAVNLQAVRRSCGPGGQPRIEECLAAVQRGIEQVRSLALDLRPSMLDDLGLVAALRWYLDGQARRVGYEARFLSDPEEIRPGPAAAIIAFRVAQEALTNIARHARARRVWVRLRERDGALRLVVRDDGVGFDVEAALRPGAPGEGMGLLGMRERAALLGGRVDFRSAAGRRTDVRLVLPIGGAGEGA